jgi:phosphate-selective porin OprO/OprP
MDYAATQQGNLMSIRRKTIATALGLASAFGATPALAQAATADQVENLQQQIRALEKKLEAVRQKTFLNASAAYIPTKGGKFAPPDVLVSMKGNRPSVCTADGFNCVGITGRLHFDVGGYSYSPNTAATTPQTLQGGVNARRARIGLVGTFARDWDFALVFDGGGSQDGTVTLNNAYLSYKGFKGVRIEGGYMDVPYTLDEATSSNNITFMERASAQVLAADLGAGDNRAAFGVRANDKWWWAGAYLTGPTAGYDHSLRIPYAVTGRLVFAPINTDAGAFLFGGDVLYLADTGGAPGINDLRMRERIEVRIDPTRVLDTGTLANVSSALVLSAEAGATVGSFHAQGEYFDYTISRFAQPDLNFKGGYIQAGYILTGERRKYSASSGSLGGVTPKDPFFWDMSGGTGAWELAARYSYVDLNDALVFGGTQKNITVGLNWYLNDNMRLMFNWIHGQVDKTNVAGVDRGAKYDAFAMRTQFAF